MKKSSLFIRLLITTILILGPTACLLFERCPDNYLPYFKITGMNIHNLGFIETDNRPVNLKSTNHVARWDQFYMSVGFDHSFHAAVRSRGQSSLYALSCDEDGSAGSMIGVAALYLITIKNFDHQFRANDTINSIIKINEGLTLSRSDFNTNYTWLVDYLHQNDEQIRFPYFGLRLTRPPTESEGEYQFKLVYILDDGEIFTKETEIVKLKQ